MSKKDYIKLANAMMRGRQMFYASSGYTKRTAFDALVNEICAVLKSDNPNFSSARFKDAIYVEKVKGSRLIL